MGRNLKTDRHEACSYWHPCRSDNSLIRKRPCAKISWLSLTQSEMGSQNAFHPGVLCEVCRHQERLSEVTSPHQNQQAKQGPQQGGCRPRSLSMCCPSSVVRTGWSHSSGRSCLQLLVTNLFFSFSEVMWKSPPRTTLHFGAVLLQYPSIKIFQDDKSHSHFFSFCGIGRGEKVQCTSLLEIMLNFNHSKCVLTVVVKWTLPHIQRTGHQFGIQKYHILKSVHWKNSRLAETPSITERASRNAFKTFRLINSSLISPYEVSIWQHLDKNFYTVLKLIYL